MAKKSFEQTGMSAALQTAQAILETGWGQSLPVDKYTSKFSYNLFGIKGSSTNGSVISNTWEVYNGITYRVDANFRAYNNVQESWDDHKGILLNLDRYKPFRDVMYHSSLGAWAVRRAGYATDPQYPLKLMRIIDLYNLKELDRIKI
jgi:flagellum-specific peptidoglycan hydrolase FlgJ